MSSRVLLGLVAIVATIPFGFPALAEGQARALDEASIKREILARYRSFEGAAEEQTWEKWQDYFIQSPNIGNMHGSRLEIGWDAYREGSVGYYSRPVEDRPAVRFEDLQVRVIDDRTAWVMGVYVNAYGKRELRPLFYDMLIKTGEGWQVFFSYVAPPR